MISRRALIHRARLLTWMQAQDVRDAYGERVVEGEPTPGPWVAARVTLRGGPAAGQRRNATTVAVTAKTAYELLLAPVDEFGAPVEVPAAGGVWETDCEVLGSPTLHLESAGETLTNGRRPYGYLAYGGKPGDGA